MSKFNSLTLSQLCIKITDGSHFSPKGVANGIPMLSVKDMLDNGFSYKDCKFISTQDYQNLVRSDCKPLLNDVLIAKDGSYLKHVFVIKNEIDQAILSSIGILRPDQKKVYPEYLKYYLQTRSVKKTVAKKYVSGSALPRIILKNFGEIDILYKDLNTQQKIAAVLSALDAKIELNNRINAELEAMAKTLYDYWFVQFDFPFPAAGSGGGSKPYKTSGGKMVWSNELKREVPEGWIAGRLESLGSIVGGSTPPRENDDYFTKCGTAWITPKDLSLNSGKKFITKGELDVSDKGIKAASLTIMPKGTILLSSRAPVGYLAISRDTVTTNQGFKSFVMDKGYSTEFTYYAIKNMIPTIENNAVGSTFKEISASTLKSIPICLPDYEVIAKYTDRVKAIFKKQNLLEVENQTLTTLRDWLLPMLMNGQVRVGG
jgi:type I restriction enzyme, S subunit